MFGVIITFGSNLLIRRVFIVLCLPWLKVEIALLTVKTSLLCLLNVFKLFLFKHLYLVSVLE